jgi:arylformamidase
MSRDDGRMIDWVDVSPGLDGPMPVWPTSVGVAHARTRDFSAGDACIETMLTIDVHSGAHVDAPLHMTPGGDPVGAFPLETFVGVAYIADMRGLAVVRAEDVTARIPEGAARILLRTDNSERRLMRRADFQRSFVGLDEEAAQVLADRGEVVLVGNDYLSIQPFGGDDGTHRNLMRRGIAILEGLDLADVPPGWVELIALPLRLDHAEAAPLRAVVRRIEPSEGVT